MLATSGSGNRPEELAHQLFDVVTRFCLIVPRSRRKFGDLKDIEFLTLSLLEQTEPLIVGDIQRRLGVLPAQMSRIIRALESRDTPYITCRINTQDKRKIDVILTESGREALQEYQTGRVKTIAGVLGKMEETELDDLHRLLSKMRESIDDKALQA
jgi:DNA-binding MarR family transcriptional regulator